MPKNAVEKVVKPALMRRTESCTETFTALPHNSGVEVTLLDRDLLYSVSSFKSRFYCLSRLDNLGLECTGWSGIPWAFSMERENKKKSAFRLTLYG